MFFKKLSFEEKIEAVKKQARKEEWCGKANLVYMTIACNRKWNDVAEYFLTQYTEDFLRKEGDIE
jgi:hypothetical protein